MKNEISTKKYLLLDLLTSFTSAELERFIKFVRSTYFNTDKYAVKLLSFLKINVIGKELFDTRLQLQAYKMIFGEKILEDKLPPRQKKMLVAKMSILTKLGKNFLTVEALFNNSTCQEKLLNEQLLEREQFFLFKRYLRKKENQKKSEMMRGVEEYTYEFQVGKAKLDFLHRNGLLLKEDNLSVLVFNLDMYYLLEKLQLYITMLSIKKANDSKKFDFSMMETISVICNLPPYNNHPIILLYLRTIDLIKDYNEKNYEAIVNLLKQHSKVISEKYLIDFYTVCCNFCAYQLRVGKLSYNLELFGLYKAMHENNLLVMNGTIEIFSLKNMVVLGARLGKFKWALHIANAYVSFIQRDIRTSVHQYNLGIIAFYQKKFKASIGHFIRVEKVSLIFDLDARLLLLKSYFEIDKTYDERTVQIFRSTERFILSNKELSFSLKRSYKNFIQILINIYRIKHKIGKRNIFSLKSKLENMNVVIDKKWLLEKIQSLE